MRSARYTGSGNVLACPLRRARHFRTEKVLSYLSNVAPLPPLGYCYIRSTNRMGFLYLRPAYKYLTGTSSNGGICAHVKLRQYSGGCQVGGGASHACLLVVATPSRSGTVTRGVVPSRWPRESGLVMWQA